MKRTRCCIIVISYQSRKFLNFVSIFVTLGQTCKIAFNLSLWRNFQLSFCSKFPHRGWNSWNHFHFIEDVSVRFFGRVNLEYSEISKCHQFTNTPTNSLSLFSSPLFLLIYKWSLWFVQKKEFEARIVTERSSRSST